MRSKRWIKDIDLERRSRDISLKGWISDLSSERCSRAMFSEEGSEDMRFKRWIGDTISPRGKMNCHVTVQLVALDANLHRP